MPYGDLDNAANAALWALQNKPREHIGALYSKDGDYAYTDTVGTGQKTHTKGTLSVPSGSLAALFHNHPLVKQSNRELASPGGGEIFSPDDIAQAHKLGIPSYIVTPSGRVMKYDPVTKATTEVLAELPLKEMEQQRAEARTSGAHNTLVK